MSKSQVKKVQHVLSRWSVKTSKGRANLAKAILHAVHLGLIKKQKAQNLFSVLAGCYVWIDKNQKLSIEDIHRIMKQGMNYGLGTYWIEMTLIEPKNYSLGLQRHLSEIESTGHIGCNLCDRCMCGCQLNIEDLWKMRRDKKRSEEIQDQVAYIGKNRSLSEQQTQVLSAHMNECCSGARKTETCNCDVDSILMGTPVKSWRIQRYGYISALEDAGYACVIRGYA